ncbi:Cytosolic iron-sulfur assembly component 3 [Saguinus oedipus]|uniref:Cytosolic iron-sulfur assembly component 3 n=1 Tax=Saguinus oedipus TaxID=9490 RepID=A0ABQ9UJE2_SAGOE|nr:Cytosolic iron-sulfur assembly component 3 [Saguinus oedipus]
MKTWSVAGNRVGDWLRARTLLLCGGGPRTPSSSPLQDGGTRRLEKAKVSLNDCLACSGCVTSAETVLITQQSHEELKKRGTMPLWRGNRREASTAAAPGQQRLVVVSVSPQSRASLAARFQLNPTDTARKLTSFFKKIARSFDLTFESSAFAQKTSVFWLRTFSKLGLAASWDFLADVIEALSLGLCQVQSGQLWWSSAVCPAWGWGRPRLTRLQCPAAGCPASLGMKGLDLVVAFTGNHRVQPFIPVREGWVHFVFDTAFSRNFSLLESQREFVRRFRGQALPVLASACPGWICYAEKTHGSFILPHISTARSPQQVMGSLVKDFFAQQQHVTPDKVYHVTVMPCYDKKLEASRPDFFNQAHQTRDVDCVLTTAEERLCYDFLAGEVFKLLEEEGVSLPDLEPVPLDSLCSGASAEEPTSHRGGGSGGYLEHVFRHAAQELFGIQVAEVTYKPLRNKDFQEVTLEKEGQVLLHFAMAYGFRNIQNLVQRLKRGRCPYHYVEVMACPSGSSRKGQLEVMARPSGSSRKGQLEVMARPSGSSRKGQHTKAPPGTRAVGHRPAGWEWEEVGHGRPVTSLLPVVRRLGQGACCDPCCLNGGGQLQAPDRPSRELLQHVERLYGLVRTEAPEDAPGVQELYTHWLQGTDLEHASRLLHTQYHAVEKASTGLGIRW